MASLGAQRQPLQDFITALGLPPETTFLQLTMAQAGIIEIQCRFYPSQAQVDSGLEVLRTYHLVQVAEQSLDTDG